MVVNSTAATQYYNRPKDESFATAADMIAAARHERLTSKEVVYNLKDLRVEARPVDNPSATGQTSTIAPVLVSPKGAATFTHWSFGQFARMVKAPAGYLRTLPAANIAADLNHGLQTSIIGSTASLLVKAPNGNPLPTLRSAASETYGRLWDEELYAGADSMIFQHASKDGTPWIAPPTWNGDAAGTWRGDRDSFVIRVDGGSIVTDPTIGFGKDNDGRMYRGIMIRNSEVGLCSVVIEWVLFQFICGNLNLWGAVTDRRYRRRHVGANVLRDTMRELAQLARTWTNRPASVDEQIIKNLVSRELATTTDAVIDELRKIGYTLEQAKDAMDTCEREFKASPRSFWGLAQGTTKNSQRAEFQDERYDLDQLAAKLMAKGAKLVAA